MGTDSISTLPALIPTAHGYEGPATDVEFKAIVIPTQADVYVTLQGKRIPAFAGITCTFIAPLGMTALRSE